MTKKKIVVAVVIVLGLMALLHLAHAHSTPAAHEGHGDAAHHPAQGSPRR